MPLIQIYLEQKEDKKISEYSDRWDISKHEAIKKIIRDFEEGKE